MCILYSCLSKTTTKQLMCLILLKCVFQCILYYNMYIECFVYYKLTFHTFLCHANYTAYLQALCLHIYKISELKNFE